MATPRPTWRRVARHPDACASPGRGIGREDCGGTDVTLRVLAARQSAAPDGQSLSGSFTAVVRYRVSAGGEIEVYRARVRGLYAGTRVDG